MKSLLFNVVEALLRLVLLALVLGVLGRMLFEVLSFGWSLFGGFA